MKDFGRRERTLFIHPRRSRGIWIFVSAVAGLAAEYALRTWLL